MIKKDSCLEDKTSVPIGTEVYGIIYSKFKIIKGNLIELVSAGCAYTKLEDTQNTYNEFINSIPEEYKYLIDENNK